MIHPLSHAQNGLPRLLVSVRNTDEAREALSGGCDLLDVKEPRRGPLGKADNSTIAETVRVTSDRREANSEIWVSAALGEAEQWRCSEGVPRLPDGLDFVKLGLAGLGPDRAATEQWSSVMRSFESSSAKPFNWIAVIYADWRLCDAPQPELIVDAAVKSGCVGVLFDTYRKDGRNLLDNFTIDELEPLVERIREAGLIAALAGRITRELLPALATLAPDVIAVRSAACVDGDRKGQVTASTVRGFKDAMESAFAPVSATSRLVGPTGVAGVTRLED